VTDRGQLRLAHRAGESREIRTPVEELLGVRPDVLDKLSRLGLAITVYIPYRAD
jgi:hypothetical protein